MTRILITDDDEFLTELYEITFDAEGFLVSVAKDVASAIREITTCPPDVVLLDLTLGEESGIDVLRFLRSHSTAAEIPVLVLSASCSEEQLARARDAGATRLLDKGLLKPRRVVQEVRNALAAGGVETRHLSVV